jgi:hypothetical protein
MSSSSTSAVMRSGFGSPIQNRAAGVSTTSPTSASRRSTRPAEGAHGAGFGLGTIQRGAGSDITRDQSAYTGQIFLGETGAGFGFLGPVLRFAIIEPGHGLAFCHPGTFFDQDRGDACAYRRADLGPMHRFHITCGVNRLDGGAVGRGGDRDSRRQAAPNPGAGKGEAEN